MDRTLLKMWANSNIAICCMLSPFLVISPVRAKYSMSKDSAPITIGFTLVFRFHVQDIYNARSWYFNIFSASLALKRKLPDIATPVMNVSWFFLSVSTIPWHISSITQSVLLLKSHKIFIRGSPSPPLLCVHTSVWQVQNHICCIVLREP